jgi:hypothetical protein
MGYITHGLNFFNSHLYKFNDIECANIPTCNLTKIMHNIVATIGKMWHLLYTTTFNDYVWAFKQYSTLYQCYLPSGPFGHGPHKNELLLTKAHMLGNLAKLVATIANYTLRSSFTTQMFHVSMICMSINYHPCIFFFKFFILPHLQSCTNRFSA